MIKVRIYMIEIHVTYLFLHVSSIAQVSYADKPKHWKTPQPILSFLFMPKYMQMLNKNLLYLLHKIHISLKQLKFNYVRQTYKLLLLEATYMYTLEKETNMLYQIYWAS